jgi:hypothetical protein
MEDTLRDRSRTAVPADDAGAPGIEGSDPSTLADALGLAWSAYTLYEVPASVEPFRRALELLAATACYPCRLRVGPTGFVDDAGDPLVRRAAAQRLGTKIFSRGAAALQIEKPPGGDELLCLFEFLSGPDDGRDPAAALSAAGIDAFTLLHRELLVDRTADGSEELALDERVLLFVRRLLERFADDPPALGARFTDEYERVHAGIEDDDHWSKEEAVHAFVDAFSLLPGPHQAEVVAAMLAHQDRPLRVTFLDQLGIHELGDLARDLDPEVRPVLLEYARIAAREGQTHHHQFLELLSAADPAKSMTEIAVGRVEAALDEDSGPVRRLRERRPGPQEHVTGSVNVFRGLLDVVDPAAGATLIAMLPRRIAETLRAGHLTLADAWLSALDDPALPPGIRDDVLAKLAAEVDARICEVLAEAIALDDAGPSLRRAAPRFALEGMALHAGREREQARRAALDSALTTLGGADPDRLASLTDDDRPPVVRAAVRVLATAGIRGAEERIRLVARHPDPGVRREVVRAAASMASRGFVELALTALGDADEGVRTEAVAVLAGADDDRIDDLLITRLHSVRDSDLRVRYISLLGERHTAAAHRELLQRARRRLGLSRSMRTERDAARRALERWGE